MLRMFYFSGTGNARNVARWMVDAWRERHEGAEAVDIAGVSAGTIEIGPDDDIGLASPTHGFNFPPVTLAFLFAFPRTPWRNRVCILNTRGGVRVFGVYVPGLSGAAQLLAAVVFMLKGYRVVGMRPVDLPSSWISLHPGLREDTIRAIYQRCEAATRGHANRVLDGSRDLRALLDLPQDLLIAPIAIGYYFLGRFVFAKSFVASSRCDACGVCVNQCPVRAVRLVSGRPYWSRRCESCLRCMNRCPKRAIETAHGYVAAFLLLFYGAMSGLVYPALRSVVPAISDHGLVPALVRFVFQGAMMLAASFAAYRLLHRALRFRPIERLVVLTSFTHFDCWRRYRPPGTTVEK